MFVENELLEILVLSEEELTFCKPKKRILTLVTRMVREDLNQSHTTLTEKSLLFSCWPQERIASIFYHLQVVFKKMNGSVKNNLCQSYHHAIFFFPMMIIRVYVN